jgi:hypothetical protein
VPALNGTFLLHGTVSVTQIAVGNSVSCEYGMGPITRVLICVEFFKLF